MYCSVGRRLRECQEDVWVFGEGLGSGRVLGEGLGSGRVLGKGLGSGRVLGKGLGSVSLWKSFRKCGSLEKN